MSLVIEVRPKGVVNISYEATFNGVKGVFGSGKSELEAVGGCMRTADSLSDLTGFTMPTTLRDRTDIQKGSAAVAGLIPGLVVKKISG